MRYRKLSASGDYQFGNQQADFWRDQPEAVAQAVKTRLALFQGSWWLDLTDGTPWEQSILGTHTRSTRDSAIQARILGTQGVTAILDYSSSTTADRQFIVSATIDTLYGQTTISGTL